MNESRIWVAGSEPGPDGKLQIHNPGETSYVGQCQSCCTFDIVVYDGDERQCQCGAVWSGELRGLQGEFVATLERLQ